MHTGVVGDQDGFSSQVSYQIRAQLGVNTANEQFGKETDHEKNNWPYKAGGADTQAGMFFDHICMPVGYDPRALIPQTPLSGPENRSE